MRIGREVCPHVFFIPTGDASLLERYCPVEIIHRNDPENANGSVAVSLR